MLVSLKAFVAANEFYIDSGCSSHMIAEKSLMTNSVAVQNKTVIVANSSSLRIESRGDVRLELDVEGRTEIVRLKNVLYVPGLCANLISVSQVIQNGNRVEFNEKKCIVYNSKNKAIATASLIDGVYRLNCAQKAIAMFSSPEKPKATKLDPDLWHRRLGHMSNHNLSNVRSATHGMDFHDPKNIKACATCAKGKHPRAPFNHTGTRATELLELIHSDICGPMQTESLGHKKYFISFIDDFTRKATVYVIRNKSEAIEKFQQFKSMAEKQTGKAIKKLRTDNGLEYCSADFEKILRENGIVHQKTAPYTSQQNGVAERFNRTIMDKVRCMLADADLSKQFWAEAVSTATYILNRIPCRASGKKTPEELRSNKTPNLSSMRVFGCRAMVHVPDANRRKLDDKSTECIFLGFSDESKAYRMYNKATKKIIVSRDVIFMEAPRIEVKDFSNEEDNYFYCILPVEAENTNVIEEPLSEVELVEEEIEKEGDATNVVAVETVPSPASNENNNGIGNTAGGEPTANQVDEDHVADVTSDAEQTFEDAKDSLSPLDETITVKPIQNVRRSERVASVSSRTVELDDPETVTEALERADAENWKRAMNDEMESLSANQTWTLVDLPVGKRPIGSKWVFKLKQNKDKSIRYKARLVARGYSQKEGIDYEETYSPVVKYSSIRYLIALAAKMNLHIRQIDVVTAFLHGDLKEEIYMLQPKAFNDGTHRVCRLNKSIYGLKQASRMWYEKMTDFLTKNGLKQSTNDQCVYYYHGRTRFFILALYVDDMLIFSNNQELEDQFTNALAAKFDITDLGDASSVIGMRITRNEQKKSISIDKSAYITKILERFGLSECNPVSTPMDTSMKLSSKDQPQDAEGRGKMKGRPYRELIGCLMYLSHLTRPDICFATTFLSRFNNDPGEKHWIAAKRILRYLKGTQEKRLTYMMDDGDLTGYCDSDYANDIDNRRSTSGYAFIMQGAAISWTSKQQATVALSTTDAEFISMTLAIQECIWLHRFSNEIRPQHLDALTLHCDNQGALKLGKNGSASSSPRTKHIDVKEKFIREQLNEGTLKLKYIETNEMIADILTKPMTTAKQSKFTGNLGIL